jgi:transposase
MKAKYEQLISTGKCKKLAITAVMRKLIVMANALLRDQRKWTQNPA